MKKVLSILVCLAVLSTAACAADYSIGLKLWHPQISGLNKLIAYEDMNSDGYANSGDKRIGIDMPSGFGYILTGKAYGFEGTVFSLYNAVSVDRRNDGNIIATDFSPYYDLIPTADRVRGKGTLSINLVNLEYPITFANSNSNNNQLELLAV
jgi:hypothetical protein